MSDAFAAHIERVDHCLLAALEQTGAPPELHETMVYGVFNGGKRVRPTLVYLSGEVLGLDPACLDSTACALEMIHAYSLIHDDLPAMDDDDLRRGKPTAHIRFGEANAILAADALQTEAFGLIAADDNLSAAQRVAAITTLAEAAGAAGMVAGQVLDLAAEDQQITLPALEAMHLAKTGALIRASLTIPAKIAGADAATTEALFQFGYHLGLAFQIQDDILDVIGDTRTLGKPVGSDEERSKSTFVSLCGLDVAQDYLAEQHSQALGHLQRFGNEAGGLRALADFVVERSH